MRGFPKEVSELITAAKKQRWEVRRTKGSHLRFCPPDGDWVTVGGTPSCRGNKNDRARLRKAGLKF